MKTCTQFFIDGRWVDPIGNRTLQVENPATERPVGIIALGTNADVDRAVTAARRAFQTFGVTTSEQRIEHIQRIIRVYSKYASEIAVSICAEMGSPLKMCHEFQAATMSTWLQNIVSVLKTYPFSEQVGGGTVVREPIGVCALITPWNVPVHQLACKIAPALAAGCTMVVKPSEISPISSYVFAEVVREAGLPPGVFNLVNGDGPTVGAALAAHPDVDMVSLTGSTRAGTEVLRSGAETIKRVACELGGKSPNVILRGVNLREVITRDVRRMMWNTGQACNAPSRMLVPRDQLDDVVAIARDAAEAMVVGDPNDVSTELGPVASRAQYDKIQHYIQIGIDEGATLVTGGLGRPAGRTVGHYVRPTIFSNVRNDMTIARDEIFGPVLCLIPYDSESDAIRIANDTRYGLAGYVSGPTADSARRIANQLRAGTIHMNGAGHDYLLPFGGYKQSGVGREWGRFALDEYLQMKSLPGTAAA